MFQHPYTLFKIRALFRLGPGTLERVIPGFLLENFSWGPILPEITDHLIQSREEGIALEYKFQGLMNQSSENCLTSLGSANPVNFLEFIFLGTLKISAYCRI